MHKGAKRFIRAYPWFYGFSSDLLFYIAIDTLFLTVAKNFTAAQIVSLTSFSQLFCIIMQIPILFLIRKMGNTASLRTGAFFLLMASIFVTFGTNYYLVLLGKIFHGVAATFAVAKIVALENNLDLIERREDFVRIRARGNVTYSVITMLISFFVSYIFNLGYYLPMFCCIATCATGFIISLTMRDCSEYNKITRKKEPKATLHFGYGKLIVLAFFVHGLFYLTVNSGQGEGKLFIQEHILKNFDVEQTALIMGAIVCVSRIVRVISNMFVRRLYAKFKGKLGVAMPILLGGSIACMLFGSFIPQLAVKISVMGLGYIIILFVRDPFNLYMQDVVFDHTPKDQHQSLIAILEFCVKLATAGVGLIYSAVLVSFPLIVVIVSMFVIALLEVILSVRLYVAVAAGKKNEACAVVASRS